MAKNAKQILISAAEVMTFAGISAACKSPELTKALAAFGMNHVSGYDCDNFDDNPSMFDNGPVSILSVALADTSDKAVMKQVDIIAADHESVILNVLGPAAAAVRKAIGLKN